MKSKKRYSDNIAICLLCAAPYVYLGLYSRSLWCLIPIAICLFMAGINAYCLDNYMRDKK